MAHNYLLYSTKIKKMQAIKLYNKYPSHFNRYNVTTRKRLACFFGRASAEVGRSLKPKQESHRYSVTRARAIFKTPFKGKSDEFIKMVLSDKEGFFNYVYANRLGNGGEASGDGWRFSGKGIFQITLKRNYEALSKDTGIDFVRNPHYLLTESYSILAALSYWNKRNLNMYADELKDDLSNINKVVDNISDIVNIGSVTRALGDANGYHDTLRETKHFYSVFHYLDK